MKYRWFDFGEKKIPYYKKEIGENSDLLHCALSIKKGSMQDYIAGTAHCLEHMMIENEHVSSINWDLVDRWAHTDFYETTYYFYASVENFEYIYDIIQGILSGDWLKKNVFNNIWPGIIEEYSNEISKVDNAKKKALFSKSIYEEKMPIGVCDSIYKIQYEDIENYFIENYLKSIPVFIVAGDTIRFEKMYKEKIVSGEYDVMKDRVNCMPLSFDNDLIIKNMEVTHIYINVDIEQRPIFYQYEALYVRAYIAANCMNFILKKELGHNLHFIECRLVRLSKGFCLIDIMFKKTIYDNFKIIGLIKNIKWWGYLDYIYKEIHLFMKQYCKVIGTNLGNTVNKILNHTIYGANYIEDRSLFQIRAEDIITFLEGLALYHKFRIVV